MPNVCRANTTLFRDVIRRRRSVRKFEPGRRIGRDVLERIVDCGRWALSGANVQWDAIVGSRPIEFNSLIRLVYSLSFEGMGHAESSLYQ
jgi:hypothetical protein